MGWRIGAAGAVITPSPGAALAGYGFRDHGAEAVLDELELRAFWIEDDVGTAACIVAADLIGFDGQLTASLRDALAQRFGVSGERVLLSASHTHSGPQTCANMGPVGGAPDPAYLATLTERLLDTVGRAKADAAPATLALGRSTLSGFAIHRRVIHDGKATMAPNPRGPRDDEVTALIFSDVRTGAPRAVLFHYTCHPTVMGDYRITGDFPGAARRAIERELLGVHAGFLPGCFGDIRPNCAVMGGGAFRRGTPEDVAAFGEGLAAQVAAAAKSATPAGPANIDGVADTFYLPIVGGVHSVGLSLQRLDLADDVSLVAMGGEMCVPYGLFVKALRPGKTTLPVGYSNGLIGYVSPARYFHEGGYEPEGSWPYFNLPGPFSPVTEGLLRERLRRLIAPVQSV